jgi:cytochrome c-type biogenesis protein CcmH
VSGRRVAWVVMLLVVAASLAVGVSRDRTPGTPEARVQKVAESVMCPTCRGQSVADSDSSAARGIRTYIDRRVDEGASGDQIRNELADRFGDDVLLTPGRSGVAGLVWALPVAALVVAVVGVGLAFRRWRHRSTVRASEADRALVEEALDRLEPNRS